MFASEQFYDAIINLGGDGQVAHEMDIHGIRQYALPFDKLILSCDSLNQLLENKFEGWLQKDNFIYREVGADKYVEDIKYGTRWIHDFDLEPAEYLKKFPKIQEDYVRRVQRFFGVIKQSKRPLFIRKGIRKEDAHILITTLSDLCGHNNFTLVALDGSDEIKTPWNISWVRNYFLRQPTPYSWKGDDAAWKEIFLNLGLTLSDKTQSTNEI
jgi:hypothetical protein